RQTALGNPRSSAKARCSTGDHEIDETAIDRFPRVTKSSARPRRSPARIHLPVPEPPSRPPKLFPLRGPIAVAARVLVGHRLRSLWLGGVQARTPAIGPPRNTLPAFAPIGTAA